MLITASAACRIIKQKAGEPVETFVSTGSPAAFGAADEARTRYLHLGKVALYQMSYGRILITLFLRYRGPRKDLRSKGLWGEGENLVFITEVLLARLPDE